MYHTPELQHSFVTLNQKTISQNRFLVEQRQIKVSMLYDMNMQLVQKQVRDMYNYNKQLNSWKKVNHNHNKLNNNRSSYQINMYRMNKENKEGSNNNLNLILH